MNDAIDSINLSNAISRVYEAGVAAYLVGARLAPPVAFNPVAKSLWRNGWLGQAAYELGSAHGCRGRRPGRRVLAMNPALLERYLAGFLTARARGVKSRQWRRRPLPREAA